MSPDGARAADPGMCPRQPVSVRGRHHQGRACLATPNTGTRIADRSNPQGRVKAMSSSNEPQIPVANRTWNTAARVLGELPGRRRLVDIGTRARRGRLQPGPPVTSTSVAASGSRYASQHILALEQLHRTPRVLRSHALQEIQALRRPMDPRRRPWRTRSLALEGAPRRQGCAAHPPTIPTSRTDRRRDGPRSSTTSGDAIGDARPSMRLEPAKPGRE